MLYASLKTTPKKSIKLYLLEHVFCGKVWVGRKMNLCDWISENQFRRLKDLASIVKSSVNERWKVIIKEKVIEPET